jgi:hypothetical protein
MEKRILAKEAMSGTVQSLLDQAPEKINTIPSLVLHVEDLKVIRMQLQETIKKYINARDGKSQAKTRRGFNWKGSF